MSKKGRKVDTFVFLRTCWASTRTFFFFEKLIFRKSVQMFTEFIVFLSKQKFIHIIIPFAYCMVGMIF